MRIPSTSLLLLLLVAGCGREDVVPEPAAQAPRSSLTLRVMTFNLRWDGFDDKANAWEHRRDLAARVIEAFDPDSVGTQEPMIRQIADLEAALPTLDSWRFDNDPKYVRTQQILYRTDRFERIDAGGFEISAGRDGDGTVRYCTWVRLRDRDSGRTVRHYNVHLDHRSAPSRQQAVVRLMAHIAASPAGDPFVVTGDFNTRESSPEMAYLFGTRTLPGDDGQEETNPIPLVDTFRVLHPDAQDVRTGSGFQGRTQGPKIDHVLVAAGVATIHEAGIVRTHDEDGRYPSDHSPVTAVIEWP